MTGPLLAALVVFHTSSSILLWLCSGLIRAWTAFCGGLASLLISQLDGLRRNRKDVEVVTRRGSVHATDRFSKLAAGILVANENARSPGIAVAGRSQETSPIAPETYTPRRKQPADASSLLKKPSRNEAHGYHKLARKSMRFRSDFKACFEEFPLDGVFTRHLESRVALWQKTCLGCHKTFRYDAFSEHLLLSGDPSCRTGKWSHQPSACTRRTTAHPNYHDTQSMGPVELAGSACEPTMPSTSIQHDGTCDKEMHTSTKFVHSEQSTLEPLAVRRIASERLTRRLPSWRTPPFPRWHSFRLPRQDHSGSQKAFANGKQETDDVSEQRGRKPVRELRMAHLSHTGRLLTTHQNRSSDNHRETYELDKGCNATKHDHHRVASSVKSGNESIMSFEDRVLGSCVASIATRAQ